MVNILRHVPKTQRTSSEWAPPPLRILQCPYSLAFQIWDVGKKYVRNILRGHVHGILSVEFSPDGRLLISGSSDGTVRIWNIRDGSSRIFHHSTSFICALRFSPDGRFVAGGSLNADLYLWELRSRHLVTSMTGHTEAVSSIVFMQNGEGFISGSWDGTLKYWNNSLSAPAQRSDGSAEDVKRKVNFVGDTVNSFLLSFWILIQAWNVSLCSRPSQAGILSVSIPQKGPWIASGSVDCTVGIWHTRTGAQQCILQGHTEKVYSVDFSPTGDYLASADWNGTVRIWSCKDLLSGKAKKSKFQSRKQL